MAQTNSKKTLDKSSGAFSTVLTEHNPSSIFQGYTSHVQELFRMLTFCRPHRSQTEETFITHYLDALPGMQSDGYGNRYIAVPKDDGSPSVIAWTSHTDTVHWDEGAQSIDIAADMVFLHSSSKSSCLGADDTTGVWLMRQMILGGLPGLYLFFRGEEHGCLGSEYFRQHCKDKLADIKAMISLDRKGYWDVITEQASGKSASDEFAASLAAQLFDKTKPSALGVFTDSNTFLWDVAECSNLSVGYFDQHSRKETQDYVFADCLLKQLLALDETKLVFSRLPGDTGDDYGYFGSGLYGSHSSSASYSSIYDQEPRSDLLTLVKRYPHEIVDFLESYGFSHKELQEHVDQLWDNYKKDDSSSTSAYGG